MEAVETAYEWQWHLLVIGAVRQPASLLTFRNSALLLHGLVDSHVSYPFSNVIDVVPTKQLHFPLIFKVE